MRRSTFSKLTRKKKETPTINVSALDFNVRDAIATLTEGRRDILGSLGARQAAIEATLSNDTSKGVWLKVHELLRDTKVAQGYAFLVSFLEHLASDSAAMCAPGACPPELRTAAETVAYSAPFVTFFHKSAGLDAAREQLVERYGSKFGDADSPHVDPQVKESFTPPPRHDVDARLNDIKREVTLQHVGVPVPTPSVLASTPASPLKETTGNGIAKATLPGSAGGRELAKRGGRGGRGGRGLVQGARGGGSQLNEAPPAPRDDLVPVSAPTPSAPNPTKTAPPLTSNTHRQPPAVSSKPANTPKQSAVAKPVTTPRKSPSSKPAKTPPLKHKPLAARKNLGRHDVSPPVVAVTGKVVRPLPSAPTGGGARGRGDPGTKTGVGSRQTWGARDLRATAANDSERVEATQRIGMRGRGNRRDRGAAAGGGRVGQGRVACNATGSNSGTLRAATGAGSTIVMRGTTMYSYKAQRHDELSFGADCPIEVLNTQTSAGIGWFLARAGPGVGLVPSTYIRILEDPTTEAHPDEVTRKIGDNERTFDAFYKTVLAGKPIAVGGQGAVYRAVYESQQVAIKVFASSNTQEFYDELHILNHIAGHVYVMTHLYAHPPGPAIMFELAVHGDAWEVVTGVEMTLADRINLCLQASLGLQHVHSVGIAHLDIKPENLLVCGPSAFPYDNPLNVPANSVVKITDFGIASRTRVSARPLEACTKRYAAPEVLQGRPNIDCFAYDVFSFGICAYSLLNEEKPDRPAGAPCPSCPNSWPRVIQEILEQCGSDAKQRPAMSEVSVAFEEGKDAPVGFFQRRWTESSKKPRKPLKRGDRPPKRDAQPAVVNDATGVSATHIVPM